MTDVSLPDTLALGRRRAQAGDRGPVLRASAFLTATLPDHPIAADNTAGVAYGMDGNDRFGTCVPTALDNFIREVSLRLTGAQRSQSIDTVFAWYRTQNPGFDPATGAEDNGMYVQQFLTDMVKAGTILGFAALDPADDEQLAAATYLFLGTIDGQTLQQAQMTQIRKGQPWDYVPGSPVAGGHCTTRQAYTADDRQAVVTWRQVVPTTDAFRRQLLEEAYVVILPEHVAHPEFREGFDLPKFAAAYEGLTGRPFPADVRVPPPPPTPKPVDPADASLIADMDPWAASITSRFGKAAKAKAGYVAWRKARGY